MPATDQEMIAAARRLNNYEMMPDDLGDTVWEDGKKIDDREFRNVFALAIYELRLLRKTNRKAQRRAMRLLRQFLTGEQKRQLAAGGTFLITAASGRTYRLYPRLGMTEGVERHGKHWYDKRSYCLHPYIRPDKEWPPADSSLAHLLLLSTDEAEFLATANCRERTIDCWNGDYLRMLRQARREREEGQVSR